MELILIFIGAFGIAFLLGLYSALSWGYVSYKAYYWFILPLSSELPQFTFFQMVGIVIFTSLLFGKKYSKKYKDLKEDSLSNYTNLFLSPWMSLLMSYLVYLYIN